MSQPIKVLSASLRLVKADVPAWLLLSLAVDSLELESWSNVCLLTQFIIMDLSVRDTYSEFKITVYASKGKLARTAVIAHDVPYVWVSV